MTQPAYGAERLVSAMASLERMKRLAESVPAQSFPDLIERQRALEEAGRVLAQHREFEKPFEPFKR